MHCKIKDIYYESVKCKKHNCEFEGNVIEQKSQDAYGNNLVFYAISHGLSSNCKEYIVSKEAFNFRRWMLFMTLFTALAFYSELHNIDVNFLGIVFFLLCLILTVKFHLKVKEESLLVIASLGLQFTTTFVTGRRASQFIYHKNIQDVVINESIVMHRVLFYLAAILKDANKPFGIKAIVPFFENTFPRLDCLEKIYEGIQLTFFMKT